MYVMIVRDDSVCVVVCVCVYVMIVRDDSVCVVCVCVCVYVMIVRDDSVCGVCACVCADPDSLVKTVAVCAGSGASVLQGVNADLFITGTLNTNT